MKFKKWRKNISGVSFENSTVWICINWFYFLLFINCLRWELGTEIVTMCGISIYVSINEFLMIFSICFMCFFGKSWRLYSRFFAYRSILLFNTLTRFDKIWQFNKIQFWSKFITNLWTIRSYKFNQKIQKKTTKLPTIYH